MKSSWICEGFWSCQAVDNIYVVACMCCISSIVAYSLLLQVHIHLLYLNKGIQQVR